MLKQPFFLFVLLLSHFASADQWEPLLNSSLSQWDTYLSYRHKEGYDGSTPLDEQGKPIPPIGFNTGNDKHQVFSVVESNGQPILRISGEIYGAITSKKSYRNYRLTLKMRWGEKKWPPRQTMLKDSGILYHAIGPHGAEHFRSWMLSQEFQIMQGHIGDYWQQASSAIDVRAFPPEYIMNPVADESQPFLQVGQGEDIKGFVLRKENYEKPHGQWNELELICFEGKSIHMVNGQVAMVLANSRYMRDGQAVPLDEGKIQIQSEAAELFIKDIYIQEIAALPEASASLFK